MNKRAIPLVLLVVTLLVGLTSCIERNSADESKENKMLDQLLTSVMTYISQHHRDAAPLIPDGISWTQVSRTKKTGHTSYVYQGNGWTVSIGLSTTAEPAYDVKAENDAAGINWLGTVKNKAITEIEYTAK
jgi:hypothetical protein